MAGTLFLIPVTLGETPVEQVLPSYNSRIIESIQHFIVEDVRTARRFLRKSNPDKPIDGLTFFELNKHTDPNSIEEYLRPIAQGKDVGVISEAGCPAIADPGADVVAIAQQRGYRVEPLVGPSSILLALMASGFNGQGFAFNGYLAIDGVERAKQLKNCEQRIYSENQTQLFIETPYRNQKLIEDILRTCKPQTKLCIAANVTCEDSFIRTLTVEQWKRAIPNVGKVPCLFLLYK